MISKMIIEKTDQIYPYLAVTTQGPKIVVLVTMSDEKFHYGTVVYCDDGTKIGSHYSDWDRKGLTVFTGTIQLTN